MSKLLQVERAISKTRRAAKEQPTPAPSPAEPEALAPSPPIATLPPAEPLEPVAAATPAAEIPPPQLDVSPAKPQPAPAAGEETPRDVVPPSHRSRWGSWVVALAIVASASLAAFDVWRRLQPAAREEPPPAPQPLEQRPQEPARVEKPSTPAAGQPTGGATDERGAATGTAREETARVLQLMERALRNAARAVNTAQARSRR